MKDLSNSIHRVGGYEETAYNYYPVLIIGAGESGIAMGCRLKEVLGFDQFRLFDRQSGVGGTWWINRYPGVACDVPALFYSFSFSPNYEWTSFHPTGPEILEYFQDVCAKYGILNNIQCNTDVKHVRWLKEEELWEVTLLHLVPGTGDLSGRDREKMVKQHGHGAVYLREEIVRAKVVCSAAGGLLEPNPWPDTIPGRDLFEGELFHSARWKANVNLQDKDVIVVGTGCSAAQLVPRLTKEPFNAKSVTQVMRSPPWVVPRPEPPLVGEEWWEENSAWWFTHVPGLNRLCRSLMFAASEALFNNVFLQTPQAIKGRKKVEAHLIRHLKNTVPEKYWEILTPDYSVGCKRMIYDAHWFPGLNDPKIDLTTKPIKSVQAHSVTLGPGRAYPPPTSTEKEEPSDEIELPADVVVLSNGFELKTWISPLKVTGKHDVELQDVWNSRGGPQAYMGNAMDGFPNLFIIFGPNTATGHSSVILASENMVEYTIKFIRKILQGDVKTFEVKKDSEVAWTKDIQEKLKDTVWLRGGCHSWYKGENGWNATTYP